MDDLDTIVTEMVQADTGKLESDIDLMEPEYGLYYPLWYVIRTWQEKREHGILPEPGGLNDQDWRLVDHDWPKVGERYNRIYRQMKGEGGFALPEDGMDWQNL